jgi:hypothetical protein
MSTIAHLPATNVLTQAHRDAMAYIQDLAITISLQGAYAVFSDYDGNVQWLEVRWRRCAEMKNGNYRADNSHRIALPGQHPDQGHDALPQLQALARELEALLTPPTGDAA